MGQKYPVTRKGNIVEEIHDVKIEDPYRWLEDTSSPEVQEWIPQLRRLLKCGQSCSSSGHITLVLRSSSAIHELGKE